MSVHPWPKSIKDMKDCFFMGVAASNGADSTESQVEIPKFSAPGTD